DAAENRVVLPDDFADVVAADLWPELDRATEEGVEDVLLDWIHQEDVALAEFIFHRGEHFLERTALVERLYQAAVGGEGAGLVLTGPPGAGKSSIFARMNLRLQADHESGRLLLLSHAFGISRRSTAAVDVLRRWIRLLVGGPDQNPIADDADDKTVEESFAGLLRENAATKRVVLWLDALDQMEPAERSRLFVWLPAVLPENVCVFATSLDVPAAKALKERCNLKVEAVPPLDPKEAEAILMERAGRAGKTFNRGVLNALLETPTAAADATRACVNPLWLELAVDRLFHLDAADYRREEVEEQFTTIPDAGDRRVALLLDVAHSLPGDVAGLYDLLLARIEQWIGEEVTRAFAVAVGLSRFGWREADLRSLLLEAMPNGVWDDLTFQRLRRSFRAHLVEFRSRIDGEASAPAERYDFFHRQMREAVTRRYLAAPEGARNIHAVLARHLQSLAADDPTRVDESLYHLIHADQPRLAALEYALLLETAKATAATRALADHLRLDPKSGIFFLSRLLGGEEADLAPVVVFEVANACNFDLHDAFRNEHSTDLRRDILVAAAAAFQRLQPVQEWRNRADRDLSVSFNKLGQLENAAGRTDLARSFFDQDLAIARRLAAALPDDVQAQRDLGVSFERLGSVADSPEEQEDWLRQAVAVYDRLRSRM
ncbi:MAG: hypothetical protein ACRC1K_17400, partial [Planctomycetia bacterium]